MRTLIVTVIAGSVLSVGSMVVTASYASTRLLAAADGSHLSEGRATYESPGPNSSPPGNDFGPGFDSVAPTTTNKSAA
jgi:hypothetical protein